MDPMPNNGQIYVAIEEVISSITQFMLWLSMYTAMMRNHVRLCDNRAPYTIVDRVPKQIEHLLDLTSVSDEVCINKLRMDRNALGRLCLLLELLGGLQPTCSILVPKQVAMFLSILAHHDKNRVVKFDFKRSGYSVSKCFNSVLKAVLRLHNVLLVSPQPVDIDCTDNRWKMFKGCLGALDGTYIKVRVALSDKPCYRNQKGDVSVNVWGVCDQDMCFTYILTGWEGSAADSRVLKNAMQCPNGLKIPNGNYYLCDSGYTHGPGFLAPYRGVRYHLDEWREGRLRPQNPKEYFNMKHSRARNVIERAFGLLKARWAILRSNSYYPIKTQNRIIMACYLLHNFIRMQMGRDPLEDLQLQEEEINIDDPLTEEEEGFVDNVEPTPEWNSWRDALASEQYDAWRRAHPHMN